MMEKITVITVCYNAENEIEKTMRSVLEQTYKNLEYIIIDGLSNDRTIEIVNKILGEYPRRDVIICSEPDNGIYDAMNKGIQKATGEWINFMNAGDCFFHSKILKEMYSELGSDIHILRGNIIRKYPKFDVKSVGVTSQCPGIMDMFNNTFHHQACLIRHLLFEKYGLYSLDYKLCSDWKFFYECVVINHVKSKYVDKTVALFSMDGASTENALKYRLEQESFLINVYGEELFALLKELQTYRKVKIFTLYCKMRTKFFDSLSPTMFNRLLTTKRFVYKLLGLNVN